MDSSPQKTRSCPQCSKVFKNKRNLDAHLVTHDPDAKVKCDVSVSKKFQILTSQLISFLHIQICWAILKNPATLSGHMSRLHSDRPRSACNICEKTFSNQGNLQRHVDTTHNKERSRFPAQFPPASQLFQERISFPNMCELNIQKIRPVFHAPFAEKSLK